MAYFGEVKCAVFTTTSNIYVVHVQFKGNMHACNKLVINVPHSKYRQIPYTGLLLIARLTVFYTFQASQ